MMPLFAVIVFLVLLAIVLMAIGLGYRFLEAQRKQQVKGMLTVVSGKTTQVEETILMDRTTEHPFEAYLNKAAFGRRVDQMIQQAGLHWTASSLVRNMCITGAIGAVIGWKFQPLIIESLSIVGLALLFGALPYLYLKYKRKTRLATIEAQLPEALDFLARSMRAGHAFSISLEMLGEESPDPIGQEFRVLFNEQNLGAPLETALDNFALRIPLLDTRLFVSSVMLQRQTGGNLSEILMRLSYIIRERFRLRGQVKAASAHGRLTALVLSILPIFVVIALMIVAPEYLAILTNDPDGKWLILGAIVAQVLGFFVMRSITNIKV